ncbi:MAG: alpha/beta hydrolase [Desulfobulbaceae bacterium]|uniref:Alpha/beta hydrolase n=1 Tax=Candidatus Desulfobia pelagia TaxID=2841692 RepID=A0A8J6TGP7_9BACT|nr:alpha/beta hydrolase [Candidatus Desulfobia pelagia]
MVVLIHGLWMTGLEMALLEKRLQKDGFRTCRFSYRSMKDDLDKSAGELFQFVEALGESTVHFVCHSLGGIVLNRMLASHRLGWKGRAVLLGSPLAGSRVAGILGGSRLGEMLIGRKLRDLLLECKMWPQGYEVGVVGGTLNLGAGLLFGGWRHPGDGLVTLDEIRVSGVKDVFLVRSTHLGLVFSSVCARQTSYFLKNGSFRE